MIFQLILPVLLTPTKYRFQDQVTPPSDRLWVVNQTFTKLDMVYSDFLWSPPDMVSVFILDSWKYGHNQFYLYNHLKEKHIQNNLLHTLHFLTFTPNTYLTN